MCKLDFRYNIDSEYSTTRILRGGNTMLKTITQSTLQSYYNYNEDTGYFTRLKKGRFDIGTRVGSLDRGYTFMTIKGKRYSAHRLAWLYVHGEFPNGEIDHINGKKSDNRLCNLRVVSQAEQRLNMPRQSRNKSGTNGVTRERNRWKAYIGVNGKTIYLGVYKDIEDAIKARKDAEVKFGFHPNHGRIHNGTNS